MKAKNFEKQFDEDVDITALLDVSKAKRVLVKQARASRQTQYPVSYTHLDVYKRQTIWCATCTKRCANLYAKNIKFNPKNPP